MTDLSIPTLIEETSGMSFEQLDERATFFISLGKKSTLAAGVYFEPILADKLWEGHYSSENEYLRDRLKISSSLATQIKTILRHYVREGGISLEEIARGPQYDLYRLATLEGTPQQHFHQALTLSRDEVNKTVQDLAPHEFEAAPAYCKICKGSEIGHETPDKPF